MSAADDDIRLLERYAATQDASAFSELVGRYQNLVYAASVRILRNTSDAEDIVQECFLRLARKAALIKPPLSGWLHRCATDLALNHRRDSSTSGRHHEAYARAPKDDESPWHAISPSVDKALDELPEEARHLLVEHYLRGRPQAQLAIELNVSAPTLSRRIEAAVAELRERLRKSGVAAVAPLGALLADNAIQAAPPTVTAALGKMAIAGIGGGKVAAAHSLIAWLNVKVLLATLLAVVAAAGVLGWYLASTRPPTPPSQSTPPTQPTQAMQPLPVNPPRAETAEKIDAPGIPADVILEDKFDTDLKRWTINRGMAASVKLALDGEPVWAMRLGSLNQQTSNTAVVQLPDLTPEDLTNGSFVLEFDYFGEERTTDVAENTGMAVSMGLAKPGPTEEIQTTVLAGTPKPGVLYQWYHNRIELHASHSEDGKPIVTSELTLNGHFETRTLLTAKLEPYLYFSTRNLCVDFANVKLTRLGGRPMIKK